MPVRHESDKTAVWQPNPLEVAFRSERLVADIRSESVETHRKRQMSKFLESAKIDTHCHFVTTSYVAAMDKFLGGNPDRFPMPEWSPEKQLEFMDQMGIVHSVISYSSPHVNFSTPEVNADLVRVGNEEGAECVKKHPGKFSVLASLPVPDVDRSLAEIAYCCDELDVDGFTLPTNTKGVYMGAKELEPVFDELDRRRALVTFHPNKPGAVPSGVGEKLPIPMMESSSIRRAASWT